MNAQAAPKENEELDELTLVRAQRGDAAAERALLERYQRPVFALISRMLSGDRSATEDLAQETFLRVFRALPGFERSGPARLSTWVFTIATRVTIDHLRRAKVRAVPVEGATESAARGPEVVERRELARAMERAVSALPADQRAAFVLFHFHERSHAEIAAALEVEVGTVKSRLSRARAALRESLREVWRD
jgi:RNA polymerase sigma-70 factor (ECF subfamily)